MRIEDTQIVKAAPEEVFGKWIDCEAWPTWLPVFTRVDVTQRAGNVVRLSLDMKVKGLTLKRTETHVLTRPEKVEVDAPFAGSPTRRCGHSMRCRTGRASPPWSTPRSAPG